MYETRGWSNEKKNLNNDVDKELRRVEKTYKELNGKKM